MSPARMAKSGPETPKVAPPLSAYLVLEPQDLAHELNQQINGIVFFLRIESSFFCRHGFCVIGPLVRLRVEEDESILTRISTKAKRSCEVMYCVVIGGRNREIKTNKMFSTLQVVREVVN